MADNDPKLDNLIKTVKTVGLDGDLVPQQEVGKVPVIKTAQTLLEQIEYFKLTYKLRFGHILWMGMATYICYDRYKAYSEFRSDKSKIFNRNRKYYAEKFGRLNQKYTLSSINPRGDPDFGDWIYLEQMPDSEQKEFIQTKIDFQHKSSSFNTFMPLYITSGICFPLSSMVVGLFFCKKVFGNASNKGDQPSKQQELQGNQDTKHNNIEESQSKQKHNSFSYFKKLTERDISYNTLYGGIAALSILSSLRIIKSLR